MRLETWGSCWDASHRNQGGQAGGYRSWTAWPALSASALVVGTGRALWSSPIGLLAAGWASWGPAARRGSIQGRRFSAGLDHSGFAQAAGVRPQRRAGARLTPWTQTSGRPGWPRLDGGVSPADPSE